MSVPALRTEWRRTFRRPAPARLSRDLLLCELAYKVQERAHGGLSRSTVRRLRTLAEQLSAMTEIASEPYVAPKPGTRLVRTWAGETHTVLVLDQGFEYRGIRFRSLSEIARTITGARWSGPRCFGLRRGTRPFCRQAGAADE